VRARDRAPSTTILVVDVGPAELLIILLVVLLLFGGAKIPKLARSLGEASAEFRKGIAGHHDDEPVAESEHTSTPPVDAPAPTDPEAPSA
jgi:sec-independent protein translocase protein TatA